MDMNKPYDPSADHLRYPTFAPIPRPQYRCQSCGGRDFGLLMPQCKLLCRGCGLEQDLPVPVIQAETVLPKREEKSLSHIRICQGLGHIVVLRPDGTVKADGINHDCQCDVED